MHGASGHTTQGETTIASAAAQPLSRGRLALLLGSLTALGPLSLDLYLPAFPELARDLDATTSVIALTLTSCLVGLAVGQLLAGPLSDAVGRRRPLIIGLLLYSVSSAICALAPGIEALTAARAAQGLSGAAGVVIARAVVRDRFSGIAVAQFFSLLILVTGLAPILAPLLGGQLLLLTGWRGLFWVLCGFGAVMAAVVALSLSETVTPELRRTGGIPAALQSYRVLIGDRAFVGYALSAGLAFAALFAYIAGSPFVLQDLYGVSAQTFGLFFGLNALGLIIGSQINRRLLGWFSPERILRAALIGTAVASITLLGVTIGGSSSLLALLLPLFAVVASLGFVLPNTATLALLPHPERAGAASALLGATQFSVAAGVGPLVGLGGALTAVPMAAVMAVTATLAALVVIGLSGRPATAS